MNMFKKIVLTLALIVFSVMNAEAAKATKQISGVVNVNTATLVELQLLPGIGKGKAQAIITYREASPFKSVDELKKVKGIGDKLLTKLTPYVVLEGATTAKVSKSPAASDGQTASAGAQPAQKSSFFGF